MLFSENGFNSEKGFSHAIGRQSGLNVERLYRNVPNKLSNNGSGNNRNQYCSEEPAVSFYHDFRYDKKALAGPLNVLDISKRLQL